MGDRNQPAEAAPLSSEELLVQLYCELRALAASVMAGERGGHTLQPTALVHEAYLRLSQQREPWQSPSHFLGLAATAMRRVLVDHARARRALKRGGGAASLDAAVAGDIEGRTDCLRLAVAAEVDLEALDSALTELAGLDSRQARVVELRFFGGLDVPAVAEVLGVSERTVKSDWRIARAWLRGRLRPSIGRGCPG